MSITRKELEEINEKFKKNEERLKSLVKGQFIYEIDGLDPFGNSYFRHQVVGVDLDEMCVNTTDLSQNSKPSKLYCFYTPKEAGLESGIN
ncbi:MAG: hypothetical protein ACOC22_01230 [bacterium]